MSVANDRSGFSLVEVIIAILILSIGVLALGSSTGYVLSQIRSSQLRTERVTVVNQAAEQVRGTAWTSLGSTCDGSAFLTSGRFSVACSVSYPGTNLAEVLLISTGPGYAGGSFVPTVVDTFAITSSQAP